MPTQTLLNKIASALYDWKDFGIVQTGGLPGLGAAMIRRAVRDANGHIERITQEEQREAAYWLTERSIGPLTFDDCCLMMELDPDAVWNEIRPKAFF